MNTPWGDPGSSFPGEIPRFSGKGPRTQRKPPRRLSCAHCPAHCLQEEEGRPTILQSGHLPPWEHSKTWTQRPAPHGPLGGWQLLSPWCRGRQATSRPSAHGAVLSPLWGLSSPHSNLGSPLLRQKGWTSACPWQRVQSFLQSHGLRKLRPTSQLPPLTGRPSTVLRSCSGPRTGPVASDGGAGQPGPACRVPTAPRPPGLWGGFHRKGPAL